MKSTIGESMSSSTLSRATGGLGGIEAQKIPMLMLQTLCCIIGACAMRNKILPADISWYRSHVRWVQVEKAFPVLEVIVRTGFLLLDLHYNMRKSKWNTDQLKELYTLIHSVQFHVILLWNVKQDLLHSAKLYKGYKLHTLEHTVLDIIEYGPVGQYSMIM